MAHLRLRQRALARLPLQAPTAVQAPVDDRRPRLDRVPAERRLRARLRRPAEGSLLRAQRRDRPGELAQEPRPLRRRVADDRQGPRLPVLHAPRRCCAQGQDGADGFVVAWDAADRARALALRGRAVRVLAAAAWQPPLRRLLGPRRARDQREDRQAHLALRGRQRGEHLRGVLEAGASSSPRTAARSTRSTRRPAS